jgi:hypothetical protein
MHDALLGELTRLMLAPGYNTEEVLTEHQRGDHGWCTCSTPNVTRPWPCTARLVAVEARALDLARRPVMRRLATVD